MSDTDHIPCVRQRRFTVCNVLDNFDGDKLVQVCPRCSKFSVVCCDHVDDDDEPDCHYYTIVYTDGSTLGNGQDQPSSGLGIALGSSSSDQYSIPVTNDIDPNGRRTNQRAELLAAIQGVKLGDMNDGECPEKRYLVIATDSQYVVNGITSWFPTWKVSTKIPYTAVTNLSPNELVAEK